MRNSTERQQAGFRFRVVCHHDYAIGAPWDEFDGYGIVSRWTSRPKRPGEMILNSDRSSHRYYDFQATIQIARRDNWGCWKNYPTTTERGSALVKAVMDDFNNLRDWCNGGWNYMGIEVFPLLNTGDEARSMSRSLWGIESCVPESYHEEIIGDLIDQIISENGLDTVSLMFREEATS